MHTIDGIRDIRVYQKKEGYRFSVDALLLAAFPGLPRVRKIADLGAGSGIIGLLLARRYPESKVTLLELQEGLSRMAARNISLNNLDTQVQVIQADIRNLPPEPGQGAYDLVVSNPPFRRPRTGLISQGTEKAIARHEIHLPLRDLLKAGSSLLKHHGRFCIIHLPERMAEICHAMRELSLEPKRMRFVHSRVDSEAKMVLIEAIKGGRTGLKVEPPLILYTETGDYSPEIREMYACPQSEQN
ncbi:MAG: tRNA1(Val) (adenine(37)-N6)-methyltransferase [Thermodesulfovibrionales bacterium]|jgi:tRNA1Val (adenine37-N6)-methyltransferase